jgi:hypothetical protein
MALWMPMSLNLSGGDSEPERVSLMIVTPDVFPALGITPVAGRLLHARTNHSRNRAIARQ